jgi:hypothetical protein
MSRKFERIAPGNWCGGTRRGPEKERCPGCEGCVDPLTRKLRPVSESLAAYAKDYAELGFSKRQAAALSQLAYGQKQLRKRLDALESMALAQLLGVVEIEGDMHKLSCAKRDNHDNDCNCDVASAVKETRG